MGNVLQAYENMMDRLVYVCFRGGCVCCSEQTFVSGFPSRFSGSFWKGIAHILDELLPCNSEAVSVLPFLIMSSEIPMWHNAVSYAAPRAGNPTSDGRHAIWPGALKPEVDASARPALAS